MKKRIGTKIYDTDRGIPVLPELNLYKQPSKKTFYLFDGETITPLTYEEAEEMIKGAGNPEVEKILHRVPLGNRNVTNLRINIESVEKLALYSRKTGIPMKRIIEDFIDSLSIE